MAQHQSQCSIFANQQLKVSNIFLCLCFFRPTALPGFRSVADPRSSTRLQIAVTEQSCQPFSGNFATIFRHPKPSFRNVSTRALSSYDILPITKVIGLTAIIIFFKYWIIYYNAMLHVNIKITTSQQRWYLLLSYFNNKINFLFSCEIRFWSLRFRQFDMSSKYSTKQYISAQCCNKQMSKIGAEILRHFWDIAVFVLRYFILPHPVLTNITHIR